MSLKFSTKQPFAAKEGTAVSKSFSECVQGLCDCWDNPGEGISVSCAPSAQKDTRPHSVPQP